MDSKTRVALRAQAHHLHPLALIGDAGLSPAVMAEINRHLNAHGLIKVRANTDDREQRLAWWQSITETTGAESIARIGKLLVLYRPIPKADESQSKKTVPTRVGNKGRRPKNVLVVKHSRNGKSAPRRELIAVKGNERLSPGGLVKTRRTRLKSAKKLALSA